jgi:hypothetical protein
MLVHPIGSIYTMTTQVKMNVEEVTIVPLPLKHRRRRRRVTSMTSTCLT